MIEDVSSTFWNIAFIRYISNPVYFYGNNGYLFKRSDNLDNIKEEVAFEYRDLIFNKFKNVVDENDIIGYKSDV